MIGEIFSDSLTKTGIYPGLELTHIDQLPVHEYATRQVRLYQSSSTSQYLDVAAFSYKLLKGPKTQSIRLTFKDAKGKTFHRLLPRSGYSNLKWPASFRFRILAGDIAYVQLNDFESEASKKGFIEKFDSIASCRALILDLRLNGGRHSNYGWDI
ncbi:S41 family peptidase [Rhodocytophaga aerolata]|uniref:S41 family peptidase n=1 Tax=Rhodocytophaga aerolata TaxID=455078 RepID=A0ABT8RDI9_9BACT|nr:S41 family peptidase [Rhodocytophaga aerolata]MDO1449303.1 S41 family peptidase [Rhodocytophaga aerolata]